MEVICKIGLIVTLMFMVFIRLGVVMRWLPPSHTWGGKAKTEKQQYLMEVISFLLGLVFLWLAIERSGWVDGLISQLLLNIGVWVMSLFFVLASIGSLMSRDHTERTFYSKVLICMSIFSIYLAF